ncbi:MAG: hypothetical protein SFU86_00605 [Pirellulaceae bacterium]|nr:hypothetical protein [Pirellulaceae bacterium]
MKYDVKFAPARAKSFYGRGEVHLHETGLWIEGGYPKFTIPFLTSFYAPLLCATTSRTIPYSRVHHHWCGSITVLKVLVMLLMGLLVGAGSFLLTMISLTGGDVQLPLILIWGLFVFVVALLLLTGRKVHIVTYRLPSGRRERIRFQLRPSSRAASAAFSKQLADYVQAAKGTAKPSPTGGTHVA